MKQALQITCVNDLCKKDFTADVPSPSINNGSPFCVVIYGQRPLRCPHCGAFYIFQILETTATFAFVQVEVENSSKIVAPNGSFQS